MILIEIKNGMVTKCLSNHKNLKVTILDHDTQTEIPECTEIEPELIGIKDMRVYIEDAVENKNEEELFPGTYDAIYDAIEKFITIKNKHQ